MNRLPASQRYKRHDRRWKRYEKQLPGHRVQIDVKFIEPIAGHAGRCGGRNKYYQLTAIDDCTRLRLLHMYPQLNQKTAIQFLDYVVAGALGGADVREVTPPPTTLLFVSATTPQVIARLRSVPAVFVSLSRLTAYSSGHGGRCCQGPAWCGFVGEATYDVAGQYGSRPGAVGPPVSDPAEAWLDQLESGEEAVHLCSAA